MKDAPTCQDCIDLLLDYSDDALSGDVKSKLEAHLRGCSPCEDFLATYRATSSLCRKAMATRMPESVANKLREFLRTEIGKDGSGSGS